MAAVLAYIGISILPKNFSAQITTGLDHNEFKCRCQRKSCHFTLIAPSLIHSYFLLRDICGHGLNINSGYRCQAHNEDVGGIDESSHTTGHAIDIDTSRLAKDAKQRLIVLAERYFDFVKVYKNFIHCHNEAKENG